MTGEHHLSSNERFPRDPRRGEAGSWIIDPTYLLKVKRTVNAVPESFDICMEQIEEVLLAVEALQPVETSVRSIFTARCEDQSCTQCHKPLSEHDLSTAYCSEKTSVEPRPKVPPRQFDNEAHLGLYTEKASANPNDALRWICPRCTTVNGIDDEFCVCRGRRPENGSAEGKP